MGAGIVLAHILTGYAQAHGPLACVTRVLVRHAGKVRAAGHFQRQAQLLLRGNAKQAQHIRVPVGKFEDKFWVGAAVVADAKGRQIAFFTAGAGFSIHFRSQPSHSGRNDVHLCQ